MLKFRLFFVSVLIVLITLSLTPCAGAQGDYLREGIEQYREENFEEAVEFLIKAREQQPDSSTAAYFLGLAYKQIINYPKAVEHLRAAVTLTPRIKEALMDLLEVLSRMGQPQNLEEANKWLLVAEKEEILPDRTAFLKGLILQKEGKNLEAIKSFEKAMSLNKAYAQAAEFQMALCYVKERDLKKASERFQALVMYDPQSDLAAYARNYQDMVKKQIEREKPLHITIGLLGQYNSNVLSNPKESAFTLGQQDEESFSAIPSVRINYAPFLKGPWLFSGQYAFTGNFHNKYSTSRDSLSNSINLVPGYNFGKYSLNLAVTYSHSLLRDPNMERYMGNLTVGPMFRTFLSQTQILEIFAGYNNKEYFQHDAWQPLEEDRDSEGLSTYISWVWLYKKDAFLNLRYAFSNEAADGANWSKEGRRFSLNTIYPLTDKLKLQISGQVFVEDYKNTHNVFNTKRDDKTYEGSIGFVWELYKNTDFIAQYTNSRIDSDISIYDYEKYLYTFGLEYRY